MARVLILCTGNSCRSQMAEAFIKHWYPDWQVFSAGTNPSVQVHPIAVKVMSEIGIDISKGYPKDVDEFTHQSFDYVITVCGNAKETCPVFIGEVKVLDHVGFDDPAEATGTEDEILEVFRIIRDEISTRFKKYFDK